MVTTTRVLTAAVLLGVLGGTAFAQSSSPLIGTWKLNVAKSKYVKGPSSTSGTTKVEASGAGVTFTVDLVGANGTLSHWVFTANYDGKDNPVTGNSPYGDAVALTHIDAQTTRVVSKASGKVTVTQTIVVAGDGRTRTVTTKGTLGGQAVDSVAVYDKQ